MKYFLALVCLLAIVSAAKKRPRTRRPKNVVTTRDPRIPLSPEERLQVSIKNLEKENAVLTGTVGALSRQLMLQQLAVEERTRSDGDSGIKQVRTSSSGTKPYHSSSFVGNRICGIHNHANNIRTVGMGEFIAVLNGVEFRTRHNDYRLQMPHRTSESYHAVQDIPFPDVPPSVASKKTVDEQVTEMREYFRAWSTDNTKIRDYRPYFKPIMCYLEGTWTISGKSVEEPFFSDRHFVDAESWFDLQEKIRFTSYSGRKNRLENYSYLPTTIMTLKNGTIPQMAQWNYRIACHPLNNHLPLNRLRMVDDISSRMSTKSPYQKQMDSRAARFQVNPTDSSRWTDRALRDGFLDRLMEQIPGKDNYKGNLTDNAFLLPATSVIRNRGNELINTAYYHRWFKTAGKDAMGVSVQHRGYSDANIFMAMTSQPKVAPMSVKSCERVRGQRKKVCKTFSQRWTYAIPMEIIYLTPLASWNPYQLKYLGNAGSAEARPVVTPGRNGGLEAEKAYNGIDSKHYYMTPVEFYSGEKLKDRDPADTSKGAVGVLDQKGVVRQVTASGTHIMLNSIEGLGRLRTRYPIMPTYAEGSAVWKELTALKDMVMNQKQYLHIYTTLPASVTEKMAKLAGNGTGSDTTLTTGYSKYNPHIHTLSISGEDMEQLKAGKYVYAYTTEVAGHSHNLLIRRYVRRRNRVFYDIIECDGQRRCMDGHSKRLILQN